MFRCALLTAAAILSAGAARSAPVPIVVELFTSQGCSSCPPADALLEELGRGRADVLPLDFHVTYWDRLGWKDPFSLAEATDRQRHYASQLGTNQVYTPQVVVGGRRQVVGSERDAVLDAIDAALGDPAGPLISVQAAGPDLVISIGTGKGEGAATLWLVGFDRQHVTRVRGGENGGRVLTEVNVVRSLTPVAPWQGGALRLTVEHPAGEHAALLLQASDGRILSAAAL